jgi:hypothetical protein
MSAGVYTLPAGATDPQKPHPEDEMYYVVRSQTGWAWAQRIGRSVSQGSVIFLGGHAEHRFYIEEELVVPVFLAPAET